MSYGKYQHDIIKCRFKTHRYRKMAIAQADFLNKITNVLGLSLKQSEMLSNDRYETISTIIHWKYDMIPEWCTTKPKLKNTRVGASYGDQKTSSYRRWDGGPPI